MSGLILKLIAIITMLIDHSTAVLVSYQSAPQMYIIGRTIGRLAFPIFSFLLVEGLLHTKDVRKYLLRLAVFAAVSEIPFNLAFYNDIYDVSHQNIYFTLFIGLAVIAVIRKLEKYRMSEETQPALSLITMVGEIVVVIVGCVAAYYLKTDYSVFGVLQIVFFYIFRNKKMLLAVFIILVNQLIGVAYSAPNSLQELYRILVASVTSMSLQSFAIISIPFIFGYNGLQGEKRYQYFFYAFYPVHLLVLYLISTL